MPEDRPGHHARHGSTDHVQVGPADGAGGEADDGISGLLDPGLGNAIETNVPDPVEYDGLHFNLLGRQMSGFPPVTAIVEPDL